MIIGIDISMLVYHGSGVARYTLELSQALLKYCPQHTYKFIYSSFRRPTETSLMLDSIKDLGGMIYDLPFPPRLLKIIWNRFHIIPVSWMIGKYDVFHSSDFLSPPLLKSSLGITTIHDLTWKKLPELHEHSTVDAHERKIQHTLSQGQITIVDSTNTKNDLLHYYPKTNTNLVHVIPLGLNDQFKPSSQKLSSSLHFKYNFLNKPYILYVGAIEPRKRLELCVDVFNELIKNPKYSNYSFIIAGRAGWKNQSLFQKIEMMNLEDKIKFIGYVEDADLPALYSNASASLYLSEYEGFGMPPLESLACGTPVLASRNSSIREFVPDRYTSESINHTVLAKKLGSLISKKTQHPLINVSDYSWKKYTESFISVIRSNQHVD